MHLRSIRRPSFAGFLGVRTRRLSLLQNPSPTPPRGSGPARLLASPAYLSPPWLLLFCFLALLARSWGLLVCGFVLWFASWVRRRPPIGLRRPPGSILGAIMAPKMIILMVCCGYFCVRCSLLFGVAFGAAFHFVFCVLWPRAKKAEERNSTYSPRENPLFSRCAPAPAEPQGRQQTAQKGIK